MATLPTLPKSPTRTRSRKPKLRGQTACAEGCLCGRDQTVSRAAKSAHCWGPEEDCSHLGIFVTMGHFHLDLAGSGVVSRYEREYAT